MDLGLKGLKVLITGASRGIGLAIAEAYAREGVGEICLAARDAGRLEQARAEIASVFSGLVSCFPIELGSPGAAATLAAHFPDADILVNNAGAIPAGGLALVDEVAWREGWDLKVYGYINMAREFYRRMRERKSGVIMNVIGAGADVPLPNYVAGSSGNAALVAFTRALGSESVRSNVRVVGINPGYVETDRSRNSFRRIAQRQLGDAERWRELLGSLPQGRMIAPREVAEIVVMLSSQRAAAVSGQVLTVDAGQWGNFIRLPGFDAPGESTR